MANAEIRTVDIDLKIDGQTRHPTWVLASSRINAFPSIQVVHHANKHAADTAVEMTSADVCAEMGEHQQRLFSDNMPKASLTVNDGKGGTLSLNGFIQNPNYNFSAFSVNLSDTILPDYAAIDSLNYSCYTQAATENPSKVQEEGFKKWPNVPAIFYNMGQYLKKPWELTKDTQAKNPSIKTELAVQQDTINKEVESYFKELMEESQSTFGWDKLKEWCTAKSTGGFYDRGIQERCSSLLMNNSGSFLSTICRFAEEYQCVYVPTWDKVGYLINRANLLDNHQDYQADIINLNLSVGGRGMFPIRYVAVTAARKTAEPSAGGIAGNACYVVYPESTLGTGSMIPKNAPPWLPDIIMTQEIQQSGKSDRQLALDIQRARKTGEARDKEAKEIAKNQSSILTEWARCCYIWEALGNTSATLTVPLDVGVQVGLRYKVKNSKGQELFSGFLAEVTHTIKSASGASGSCQTVLKFTHVALTGFKLPQ